MSENDDDATTIPPFPLPGAEVDKHGRPVAEPGPVRHADWEEDTPRPDYGHHDPHEADLDLLRAAVKRCEEQMALLEGRVRVIEDILSRRTPVPTTRPK